MSKVLLFAAFLLLSVTWVVAQNSDTTGSQSSQSGSSMGQSSSQSSASTSSGNETSIEGCLSGSAGSYTLTSSTGTTYQLNGPSDDLSKHVNQQVRVKGTESASSASSSSTSPSSSSSSTTPGSSSSSASPSSSSQPSFTVSKVSKISDTCSASNK